MKLSNRWLFIVTGMVVVLWMTGCLEDRRVILLETYDETELTHDHCILHGAIIDAGNSGVNEYGFLWKGAGEENEQALVLGASDTVGPFSADLHGLEPGTSYYFRAYAKDEARIYYGNNRGFTTFSTSIPELVTERVTNITLNSADVHVYVSDDHGLPVTDWGVCFSTEELPNEEDIRIRFGSGTGRFIGALTGLAPDTHYFVCGYATNKLGTAYGNQVHLRTYSGIVTDIDGNGYFTVEISEHTWLASNLKTTRFQNGDDIPLVSSIPAWLATESAAMTYYDNDVANADTFGALYNWYAVNDDRNLCPVGFFPPTTKDWQYIRSELGDTLAGGKMKVNGTAFWKPENKGGTNESGFSALPEGGLWEDGRYKERYTMGSWWAIEDITEEVGRIFSIASGDEDLFDWSFYKTTGLSVRCLKDNSAPFIKVQDVFIENQPVNLSTDMPSEVLISDFSNEYTLRMVLENTGRDIKRTDNQRIWIAVTFSDYTQDTDDTLFSDAGSDAELHYKEEFGQVEDFHPDSYLDSWVAAYEMQMLETWERNTTKEVSIRFHSGVRSDMQLFVRAAVYVNERYYRDPEINTSAYEDAFGYPAYRAWFSFQPDASGTFADTRDSRTYEWVKIGNQVWMAENLAYLTAVSPSSESSTTAPLYYVFDYEGTSVSDARNTEDFDLYGVLYNWAAAMNGDASSDGNPSGVQGICPDGWHLPSDNEWQDLELELGMDLEEVNTIGIRGTDEGSKLKSTDGWNTLQGTNSSGFNCLPAGCRNEEYAGFNSSLTDLDQSAYFYTSTESDASTAWFRGLSDSHQKVERLDSNKGNGFSIRCVKD
jgi:uncharacterized protein (TIGR02145 family)